MQTFSEHCNAQGENPAARAHRALPGSQGCSTCVVQGSEDPELIHGVEHVVLRRRVHEVELQQVLHPQGLEQQHHVGQVGPLDLRHRGGQELILIGALGVEPAKEKTESCCTCPRTAHGATPPQLLTARTPHSQDRWKPQVGEFLISSLTPPHLLYELQISTYSKLSPASLPFCWSILHDCLISGTNKPGTTIVTGFYILNIFLYFLDFYSEYIIFENQNKKRVIGDVKMNQWCNLLRFIL